VKAHLDECAICTQVVRLHRSYKGGRCCGANRGPAPHVFYGRRPGAEIAAESHGRWARGLPEAERRGGWPRPAWERRRCSSRAVSRTRSSRPGTRWSTTASHIHKLALPLDFPATDPRFGAAVAGEQAGLRRPRPALRPAGSQAAGVCASPACTSAGLPLVTYSLPQSDGRRVSLLIVDDPEQQLAGDAHRVCGPRSLAVARQGLQRGVLAQQ